MSDNIKMTDAKHLTPEQEEEQIRQIGVAVHSLGWSISVPVEGNPNDPIPGMIIGTSDYIDHVLDLLKKGSSEEK